MSLQVASQTTNLPHDQGMMHMPSGLFPSVRDTGGFTLEGIFAEISEKWMISLKNCGEKVFPDSSCSSAHGYPKDQHLHLSNYKNVTGTGELQGETQVQF